MLVPADEARVVRFGYPVPGEVIARAIERLRDGGRRRSAIERAGSPGASAS